jgi:hypothetical protein
LLGARVKNPNEQFVIAGKANIEAGIKLALLSLEHSERLLNLNIRNTKISVEYAIFGATAYSAAQGVRGLAALHKELAEVGIQETAAYSRCIYRVAVDAAYDFSALAEVAWTNHTKTIETWRQTATDYTPSGSDIVTRMSRGGNADSRRAREAIVENI